MDNLFTNLNEGVVTPVETVEATPVVSSKKERIEVMRAAIKETLIQDPEFKSKVRSLSNSIEVVNTLGFGDSGNIVVDKANTTTEGRALAVTSQIIGYRVRNIGTEPIKYQTEVWSQGEDGKYVASKAEKTLAPSETADLTRQYMTIFTAQPEISFQLANGKIIKGSGSRGDKSIKAELESHYFRFDKAEDGTKKQVNDDTIKLNVGKKVDGDKWVVKEEFVETFGFLNNPKETTKGGRTSPTKEFNAQDIAANYVNKLISEAGLL